MNLLIAGIFILFILIIGIIPFRLLYVFTDFVRFILQRIVGYRKKVILGNLKACYPDADDKEMRNMVNKTYKNLADVLVEGIKAFTMTRKQVYRRHRFTNPELLIKKINEGQSVIVATAHYGNWDWGTLSTGLTVSCPILILYKPMSNKYIDRYVKRSRSVFGSTLVSIYNTGLVFERHSHIPSIYVMAADQSPSNPRKSYWFNFMGRDTAFLHGPEKYARLHNLPVSFAEIKRQKRGFYTLELSMIAENPLELEDGEITRRYAAKLESMIRANPGDWLWSHRRWKLKRPQGKG